jgi:heme A synthase
VRTLARLTTILVLAQVGLGIVNVVALAPIWMQLAHLVVADAVWIGFVLTAAGTLSEAPSLASSQSATASVPATARS